MLAKCVQVVDWYISPYMYIQITVFWFDPISESAEKFVLWWIEMAELTTSQSDGRLGLSESHFFYVSLSITVSVCQRCFIKYIWFLHLEAEQLGWMYLPPLSVCIKGERFVHINPVSHMDLTVMKRKSSPSFSSCKSKMEPLMLAKLWVRLLSKFKHVSFK